MEIQQDKVIYALIRETSNESEAFKEEHSEYQFVVVRSKPIKVKESKFEFQKGMDA